jgi:hypothetical protein
VHDELTVGQLRDLARSIRPAGGDGPPDYASYPIARILAALVGWSFVDASGQPAAISQGALEFLRPAVFNAITAALDAHDAARDAEKKTPATNSDRTSPSVASWAGRIVTS